MDGVVGMICSLEARWIDWIEESVTAQVLEDGTCLVVADLRGLTTKNKGPLSCSFFNIGQYYCPAMVINVVSF